MHFSQTPNVPVVFQSPNTVYMSKVLSETQGNFLIAIPRQIKKIEFHTSDI